MKLSIACDLDGCLVDFNTGFAKLLKKINPTVKVDIFDASFPVTWGWPKHYGYTAEDQKKAWTEVENSGLFWRSLHPYATAWDDLEFLQNQSRKHDIYFVTSRPGKTAKDESEQWLVGHGFKLPTVIISHDKQAFCAAVKANIIIDDKPDNLFGHNDVKTALFRRPYNDDFTTAFSMNVNSFREALKDVV